MPSAQRISASRRRSAICLTAALLLVGALGGCGSSGNDNDNASAGSAPVSGGASRAELEANVTTFTKVPTSIGVTEPLKALPTGKTVGWIGNGTQNDLASFEVFKEAAAILGLQVTSLANTSKIEDEVAAIEQAISRHFDIVVLNGVLPSALGPQLKELHESGTKILGYALSIRGFTAPNIDFAFFPNEDGDRFAEIMGDWLVLNTKGPAHILVPYAPDVQSGVEQVNALRSHLKETCPACTMETLDFSFAQIGSTLPSRIASAVEANPEINAIYAPFGAIFTGVPEALGQAGLKDRVVAATASGIPVNMQQIQSGNVLGASMDIGLGYRGYMLADGAARLLAGQTIPTVTYEGFDFPVQVHTKDNLNFDISKAWEGEPADYKTQFKKLWSVG